MHRFCQLHMRLLLAASETGDGFSKHYFDALQRDPDVVLAHGQAARHCAGVVVLLKEWGNDQYHCPFYRRPSCRGYLCISLLRKMNTRRETAGLPLIRAIASSCGVASRERPGIRGYFGEAFIGALSVWTAISAAIALVN